MAVTVTSLGNMVTNIKPIMEKIRDSKYPLTYQELNSILNFYIEVCYFLAEKKGE